MYTAKQKKEKKHDKPPSPSCLRPKHLTKEHKFTHISLFFPSDFFPRGPVFLGTAFFYDVFLLPITNVRTCLPQHELNPPLDVCILWHVQGVMLSNAWVAKLRVCNMQAHETLRLIQATYYNIDLFGLILRGFARLWDYKCSQIYQSWNFIFERASPFPFWKRHFTMANTRAMEALREIPGLIYT